jgi:hypothetical protein
MNENELTRGLRSAVADVTARPDLAEVELGAARVRTRRRVATGVVAAMLVAGAGGTGFGIGRSLSGGDDGEIAGAASTATTEPAASETDDPTEPIAPPTPTTVMIDPPTVADAARPVPRPADDSGGDVASGALDEGALGSYYLPRPMELVYERLLDDGVRVRVQRGQSWANEFEMPDGQWQPAGFCWGSAEMRITIDGPDVVDLSGGSFFDELFRGVHFEVSGAGWADDHEVRIVTVQTDLGVTSATVRWADGPTDIADVVDGLAVLVVSGSQPWENDYTIELTGGDGARTLTQADLDYYDDPEWRAACTEPPPSLPEPGQQPGDPEAARAAIEERLATLWNTEIPQDDKLDLLDDWTGVQAAQEAVAVGGFADVADTAVHTIEDLVFASPTEAWFRYSIATDVMFFDNRYGTATLVDGVWQFPRALVCQDLALAGGGCEPWVDGIYPPSWYDRYGVYEECYEAEDGSAVCEVAAVPGPIPLPTTTIAP